MESIETETKNKLAESGVYADNAAEQSTNTTALTQMVHEDNIEEEPKVLYVDVGEDITLHLRSR